MNATASEGTPDWLTKELVLALHAETLSQFGGSMGVRDEGLLESALARPRNRHAYGDPSLFELAAVYCAGIVQNHPFIDGNKRTGLLSARAFPYRNGYHFEPKEGETVHIIRRLAASEIDENELMRWIETYSERREST